MAAGSEQLPLKVCRHCSVASRTDSATCPNCGRSYGRGGPRWRWWYAIPIVLAAFAVGYFGISELVYDDDGISADEAAAIELGAPRADVEETLGEPNQTDLGSERQPCISYELDDEPDDAWLFCFREDALVASEPVAESQ